MRLPQAMNDRFRYRPSSFAASNSFLSRAARSRRVFVFRLSIDMSYKVILVSESPGHIVRANKYPARWPYRRVGGSTAIRRASDSPIPFEKVTVTEQTPIVAFAFGLGDEPCPSTARVEILDEHFGVQTLPILRADGMTLEFRENFFCKQFHDVILIYTAGTARTASSQ